MNKPISNALKDLFESEDGHLFEPPKKASHPTADDRLTESFNQITDFVEKNERLPEINSTDIAEASLASRLESIKFNEEKANFLKPIDRLGLLDIPSPPQSIEELFENDSYGLFKNSGNEILRLKNIPKKKLSKAESIERRKHAKDFDSFKAGFVEQQNGLKEGRLKLVRYYTVGQLHVGNYYVHNNQMLRIVDVGEKKRVLDRNKERFRIIFENSTESNMYRRSLSARLYEGGYAIVDANHVDESQELLKGDFVKGYIYILSSQSLDPNIVTIKDLYKIGYSTTSVDTRIKDAEKDPTYLMAPVKVVGSYVVTNDFNPQKIEYFLHRIFADAALDLDIIDPNGKKYRPLEWYSVPLKVIDQAINLLQSGDITNYIYDTNTQKLILIKR